MVNFIFFAALSVFPFGQIFKLGFVNLFDVVVGVLAVYTLFKRPQFPSWYKYLFSFILFGFFSWLVNLFLFKDSDNLLVLKGLLYLLRFFAYSLVGVYVYNFFKDKRGRDLVFNSLLLVSSFSAVFGWAQYLVYWDVRPFKIWGWDDHLYRVVGTFIDPTFLGIILVLGVILAIFKNKNSITLFLMLPLALTYSRASALALLAVLLWKKKILLTLIFIAMVLLAPVRGGEGTNLKRTASGYAKVLDYTDSLSIIEKTPLIGVGFNNICTAKFKYLSQINLDSHSCFGLDSSILFILATTGTVGLILFIYFVSRVQPGHILFISFIAVLIHSLFSNSLFYPHVMFWLFSLLGLQREVKS